MSKKIICIIGKGHSGTRAIAKCLQDSGVFMGSAKNLKQNHGTHIRASKWKHVPDTMDKGPTELILEICNISQNYVTQKGCNYEWDFSKMLEEPIPPQAQRLYEQYLSDIHTYAGPLAGWKITEASLFYPWSVRLYPETYYIHLVRDVRSHIFRQEYSDTMEHTKLFEPKGFFDIPTGVDTRIALNWKYQLDLVESIKAKKYIQIKFEDFLTNHNVEIDRLSDFLEMDIAKIPVHPEMAESWREDMRRGTSRINHDVSVFGHPDDYKLRKNITPQLYPFLDTYMDKLNYPDWK